MASILISSAYLPPAEYFAAIKSAGTTVIEKEENYLKQTYRNRCYILSPHGPHALSVPVYMGSFHKIPLKDIRIDYSKRWQQVHLRALEAAYGSSPFFIFYYELLEKVILSDHEFLIDLNTDLLRQIIKILKISTKIEFSTGFAPPVKSENDFRYRINPKVLSSYKPGGYSQVFKSEGLPDPRLSIVDLIFNTGTGAVELL